MGKIAVVRKAKAWIIYRSRLSFSATLFHEKVSRPTIIYLKTNDLFPKEVVQQVLHASTGAS
jgi:hypothetical protein